MKYTELQILWLRCKASEYIGRLDELTDEFNRTFGLNKTRKAIESAMHKRGIRNRYFGEEQMEWLLEHRAECSWQELTDRYNYIYGEGRSKKSIICAVGRAYDKQRLS